MRITFILPAPNQRPIGGFRVVYEYADRLAGNGHKVTVLFSVDEPMAKFRLPMWFRKLSASWQSSFTPRWFRFKNGVRLSVVPEITDGFVPNGDAVFATWWASAYPVSALSRNKGEKYYLIQHHETWAGNLNLLHHTYHLGLKNVVISLWLSDLLLSLGAKVAAHIPNGLDFSLFRLLIPIEERNPFSTAMMYHQADWKGSGDGIKALEIIKKEYPLFEATLFSVYPRPKWLPLWIEFVKDPSQAELVDIYNRHAIFLNPSWTEGWPLPPAEAMACGCALVSTDIDGVKDYAHHEETCLLSPVKDPYTLAETTKRFLFDNTLRIQLARAGNIHISSFTWDNAVTKLEELLNK